jgi:hypothetical protein
MPKALWQLTGFAIAPHSDRYGSCPGRPLLDGRLHGLTGEAMTEKGWFPDLPLCCATLI